MFCPNCGAENTTEQNFCRSCGLNLEKIAGALLEQIPSFESANLASEKRRLEKFGNVAFGGFATVFLLGVSLLVFYIFNKLVLSGENALVGILLVAFIIFAVLTLIYVFFNGSMKDVKQNNYSISKSELEGKDIAKLLEEKSFETIPSVTEQTTDFLHAEHKTRKFQ